MRSNKPEAQFFQGWVTKVVLPAIRKDGAYIMGEEKVASGEESEDELVLKALGILQKKVDRITQERDRATNERDQARTENVKLDTELKTLDVDGYARKHLKMYLKKGIKIRLGQVVAALSKSKGYKITKDFRTLECGRQVPAALYELKALDEAATMLGMKPYAGMSRVPYVWQ